MYMLKMDASNKSMTSDKSPSTSTATSTLKEVLKINSSKDVSADAVESAAQVFKENFDLAMNSNMTSQSVNLKENSKHQEISLENVEDGVNVQLRGAETRIITNPNTENDCFPPASNKVTFSNITKFEWDHQYYQGSLISVSDNFMAYSLKAGRVSNSVRVINRQNSSDRALLKGFSGAITDVAFSHAHQSNLLAAVDNVGNFLVWTLNDAGGNIESELKLHVVGEKEVNDNPVIHRLAWIPSIQNKSNNEGNQQEPLDFGVAGTVALFYNNVAEVWDINLACELVAVIGELKLLRSQINQAFITVVEDVEAITDCELSPLGGVLAIACSDGFLKFWQVDLIEESKCLQKWKPHDGRPLSAVRFCDDLMQDEPRVYWRFMLTSCNKNTELKMWCAVTWKCLQVINFRTASPELPVPEMNLVLHRSSNFLVLSDIHRKVLYVMQVEACLKREKASIVSISHYTLTLPILSQAIISAEKATFTSQTINVGPSPSKSAEIDYFSYSDDSRTETTETSEEKHGYLVKLLTIQRRTLQNLEVRFEIDGGLNETNRSENMEDSINKTGAENSVSLLDTVFEPEEDSKENVFSDTTTEKKPIQSPASTNTDVISPAAFNPSTPVLITPDALMGTHDNMEKLNETANSNGLLKSVEDQKNEETVDSVLGIFKDHQDKDAAERFASQSPSSSADPRTIPTSTPINVAELLHSFQSSATVVSPDLISGTSTYDDTRQQTVPSTTISAPPGLPARPIHTHCPLPGTPDSNIFASILLPLPANSGSWPEVPDVAVSHQMHASAQSSSGSLLSAPMSSGNVAAIPSTSSSVQVPYTNPVDESGDHFSQSIDAIRHQNEEGFQSQKVLLDEIMTKQNQMKNKLDVANKQSNQAGERIEKAMTSIRENQRQISSDIKNSLIVSDSMVAKIDRTVKAEFKRTILPGVTSSIGEIEKKLTSTVATQLAATDSVLKETISKCVKSKDLVDKVVSEISKVLRDRIETVLPNIFMQTLVPSFERACQEMFRQLASTYQKGMEETTKRLEKQMQFRLKSDCDKMQQITKDADDTVRQLQNASKQIQKEQSRKVQEQFSQNTKAILKSFEESLSSRILQSIKEQQDEESAKQRRILLETLHKVISRTIDEKVSGIATQPSPQTSMQGLPPSNSPLLRQLSSANQREQILKILHRGDVNAAFQTALNASDLSLVLLVCETVDPRTIFVAPCSLQQPTILSLIQQLSNDLDTKTDLKLRYLQDSIMNLNPDHEVTKKYMHTVLRTLIQNLNAAAIRANQTDTNQLRVLSLAAKSLMR